MVVQQDLSLEMEISLETLPKTKRLKSFCTTWNPPAEHDLELDHHNFKLNHDLRRSRLVDQVDGHQQLCTKLT